MDGRTREARIVRETTEGLIEHLGGEDHVTAPQRLLIQATAILTLRLRCALDRYANGQDVESLDRHVVALQNGLRQNLLALGMDRPERQPASLTTYLELRGRKAS